jgi:hypothetical protein
MMQKNTLKLNKKCEAELRDLFSLEAKMLFLLFQNEQCEAQQNLFDSKTKTAKRNSAIFFFYGEHFFPFLLQSENVLV